MEKLLINPYDKECMKLAMLKHEETFREQVYELHRLYQIQKILMKEVQNSGSARPEIRPEEETDHQDTTDLELTLGPKIYYHKKYKAAEPARNSDPGSRFSCSSSTGSSQIKRTRSFTREELKWGLEMSVSNQDRINYPPWTFQALSLNMT